MDTTYCGTQSTKTIGSLGYVTGFAFHRQKRREWGLYAQPQRRSLCSARQVQFLLKNRLTLNGLITNYRNRNYKQW